MAVYDLEVSMWILVVDNRCFQWFFEGICSEFEYFLDPTIHFLL
jgi:hypothetical protein